MGAGGFFGLGDFFWAGEFFLGGGFPNPFFYVNCVDVCFNYYVFKHILEYIDINIFECLYSYFPQDQSTGPQWMLDTHKVIKEAEGFVIVTAEYKCSLPPALTNLLDYFPPASYRHKPASIASYSMGTGGGSRAAALCRPFLAELGMVSLPSILLIPTVQNAKITEDGDVEDNERVVKSSTKMCEEMV